MTPYTHTVCAAIVLTFGVSVASAQNTPAEGGANSAPKSTQQQPAQQGAQQPAQQGAQQPAQQGAQQPAQQGAQQPAQQGAQQPAQQGAQQPTQEPAQQPTQQPTAAATPGALTVPPPSATAKLGAAGTTPAVPAVSALPPITPPPGYVIGTDDILSILFWKDKDMSTDVAVRPDGKISLSLINEVDAAGLTPDQLRIRIDDEAKKYMEDATVTVVVKQINSRKVYITGQVAKQGPYVLSGPTTVAQLISLAGGVAEFADAKNIVVIRTENGRQIAHKFNYKDVMAGKKLAQNIELKPGDTILVP